MNLVPEVFFSREIGACFATIDVVSNYGEGVVSTSWEGGLTFSEFQRKWGHTTAMVLLQTVAEMDPDDDSCGCGTHRWESTIN
jgi:purine nucleoside phosphorylase